MTPEETETQEAQRFGSATADMNATISLKTPLATVKFLPWLQKHGEHLARNSGALTQS